jgi:hypothetical protein
MSSIVRIEITYCLRSPNVNVDQTSKRYNRFFSISPASKLAGCPNNLFFIDSFSTGVVIPPENPNVWTAFTLQLKETSLLKPVHAFSFPFPLYSVRGAITLSPSPPIATAPQKKQPATLSQMCRDFTPTSRSLSICAACRRAPTSSPRPMRETLPRIFIHWQFADLDYATLRLSVNSRPYPVSGGSMCETVR